MRYYIISIILLFSLSGYSQDNYQWWNELVDWDGTTHWSRYHIHSPRYFGPNALRIPELTDPLIRDDASVIFKASLHMRIGEQAESTEILFTLPVNNKISFFGSFIPFEHYEMTTAVRDERRSRDYDGVGYAIGDLSIGTRVKLISGRSSFPDATLTSYFKTALGTNREALRYTDAPAYYFGITMGKSWILNQLEIRPLASAGLFVWQTNEDKNPQNDALAFALGMVMRYLELEVQVDYSSYKGYKDNGDHAGAITNRVMYTLSNRWSLGLTYVNGKHDNLYQEWAFQARYYFVNDATASR